MEIPTLFYLALLLFSGLIFGRAVKFLRLPNVTGYLIAGLIIGPYCLKILSLDAVADFELISEMALAFIAFTIGSQFKLSHLKNLGIAPAIIAIFEALTASVLVSVVLIFFGCEVKTALLLGAIASATAPAATVMVIRQYNAKGPVTSTLLSVVALDDAVAIICFGFVMALINMLQNPLQGSVFVFIIKPIAEILGSVVFGFLLGVIFNLPLKYFKKASNRLAIIAAFVFLGAAVASVLELSALLLCMCMGATLVNVNNSANSVFGLLDNVTAPIFLMFFVVSGAQLNITILPQIGLIGIVYVIVRVVGKVLGSYIGAIIAKSSSTVKKYLGFALIPQAGVAIGLSLIASKALPQYGPEIRAVVLCATFIYELIGPVVTKIALEKSGEIKVNS